MDMTESQADSIRNQQQDADDREAERRAKIPTPRTDEQDFNETGGYDVDWTSFARILERDLADLHRTHISRETAAAMVHDALRSQSDPGAFTKRIQEHGNTEPLHQWQRRALAIVVGRLNEDLPKVRE